MRINPFNLLVFGAFTTAVVAGPLESKRDPDGEACTVARVNEGRTVVIDPGHGGKQAQGGSSANNAVGPKGTLEKVLTLGVAQEVASVLRHNGYTVVLTRRTDENSGLADRAKVARDLRAQAFVSIHFNGDDNASVQGTETLYHPQASAVSIALAEFVQRRTRAATGLRDRGVKPQGLSVLDPALHDKLTAACLVEVSFLTDPAEEARLLQEVYRKRIAEAIAAGIADSIEPR